DVVRLNRQLAMFFTAIDEHCELHAARPTEVDQLIECGANRTTGVKHVVDQNDVAVFDVAGKICAIDDWLGANSRKIVTIERDVEYADGRSITFEVGNLLRHAFCEWDAATSDSNKKQVAGAVIFFDDFGRQARQ